jgi:CubicO group peptidase (beta-lactamase class C family)
MGSYPCPPHTEPAAIWRVITAGVTSWLVLALLVVSAHGQALTDRIDHLVAKWNQKNGPGLAAMLIRDGRIVYQKGVGLADLDAHTPIAPNTQFQLASMTKQFTAMAVMILRERGKLQFDDSLSKFCPEFPDYARTITIRHLLNHTSGLPDYEELLLGKVDYDKLFQSSKSPRAVHEFTSAEALQVLSRQQQLRFLPGEKWEYSNSGYLVLAQIIERLSRKRYAEFVKETIFDPLGMYNTLVVDERRQHVPRLAVGYSLRNGRWQDISYSAEDFMYGDGGIHSTVDDLYKWDQALYTERLVRRATLEMAFTPGRTNDGKETNTFLTGFLKRPTSYGFGWFITSLDGNLEVEHAGNWSGYRSYIIRVPSRRLTAIVLMNSAYDQVREIAQGIIDIAGR